MRFKHAISIAIDNFFVVYKLLFFQLVTGIIFFGLGYAIISINLNVIFQSEEAAKLVSLIQEFFAAITSGNVQFLNAFRENFLAATGSFMQMLGGMMSPLVWSLIGVVLLYLCSRFVNGLFTFTAGIAVDNRMETYGKTKFSNALFSNLGSAALYQLIYVPFSFFYTVLTVVVCWFVFFYALSFLPLVLTIALAVAALVVLQALKFTLISAWMPLVIRDKVGVCKAFRQSFAWKRRFWSRFANYVALVYMVLLLNVGGAICTFGSILFLSIPLTFLLFLCLQFVCFFEDTGKKYFISYNKIGNDGDRPPVLGNS